MLLPYTWTSNATPDLEMKKAIAILCSLLLTLHVSGQTVFESYYAKAKAFAEAFPREKVHLHFDNTSYYQGDTIWFKAYVVNPVSNTYSRISKPLYVELIDQLGNVMERQIVKLTDGQGKGQLSLSNAFFTGYYEVRAYTKWMLSFTDDIYFTRTFPIYKKPLTLSDHTRQIAEYRMDESMKQRPKDKLEPLTVNFYPEGGRLVQGVPSIVGIETLSRDSGWVNISGILSDADGNQLIPVSTIHDGMGSFMYTPTDRPATLEFNYGGKRRSFKLPAADRNGYAILVNSKESEFDVTVSRSASTPPQPLALFITTAGMPQSLVTVDLSAATSRRFKILSNDLPAGVTRLSLVNEQGMTLLDRFIFVYPKDAPVITAETSQAVYASYSPIDCTVKVRGADGSPIAGVPLSLSVRDASTSDYIAFDSNIAADLLLTSELKGYINRPEYYLAHRNSVGRKMLDNLMIIRGWRNYDLQQAFGVKEAKPQYMPEDRLILYGKVKSYFQGSADLGVTILVNNDTASTVGNTVTDSLGRFSVPIDDFEGRMDALFQTRKEGKKINRASTISLERGFEPSLRKYDYDETNPTWDIAVDTVALSKLLSDVDPYLAEDSSTIVLGELVVKAKNKNGKRQQDTERFERSILGYYNIRNIVDEMRDKGRIINGDIGNLMHEINPNINYKGTYYKVDSIVYCVGGRNMDRTFIDNYIDEIETAMLYYDRSGTKAFEFDDNFQAREATVKDYWTEMTTDTANVAALRQLYVRLDFTMSERFDPNRSYLTTRGIRKTYIQGYNRPAEFYTPQFPEGSSDVFDDHRRTLYWNPDLVTDGNGEISLRCYNSRNATYLTLSAETLVDGKPAALSVNSIEASKGDSSITNAPHQQ